MTATSSKQASRTKTTAAELRLLPELACPHAFAPFLRRTPLPVLVGIPEQRDR